MPQRPLQRILYVEDEECMRTIVQVVLEDVGGFDLRVCRSGREAVDVAPGYRPQLVLLDVMMPDMDGPATFRALRALPELAGVPMVFMTAMDDAADVQEFRDLGAAEILLKPIDPATLAEDIREIWGALPAG